MLVAVDGLDDDLGVEAAGLGGGGAVEVPHGKVLEDGLELVVLDEVLVEVEGAALGADVVVGVLAGNPDVLGDDGDGLLTCGHD